MENENTTRVLIVDDQANWREALTLLLSGEGYAVQTASCFEAALEKIAEASFDLAVLDIRLVDGDVFNVQGLELLKRLKALDPAPIVIILTGYPESLADGVLEELDADTLILKVPPDSRFRADNFKEQVRRLLQEAKDKQASDLE